MSEEFSAGVKILLQRMETNPEEFYEEGSKTRLTNPRWANLLSLVVNSKLKGEPVSDTIYLNPAEIDALYEGYKKIRRKAFDDQIMRTVLAPEEELSSSQSSGSLTGRMRLDASGAIGIGTVSSGEYLSVRNASAQLAARQQQMMNAYPYSNYPYDEEPAPQSMMSQIAKRIGIK